MILALFYEPGNGSLAKKSQRQKLDVTPTQSAVKFALERTQLTGISIISQRANFIISQRANHVTFARRIASKSFNFELEHVKLTQFFAFVHGI